MDMQSDSALLNIPAEIREQIYREVLSTRNSKYPPDDPDEPTTYKYHLDIILVNHQVHHEAKKIFQDNVFIKITTPWPEAIGHIRSEGKVPSVTTGDKAASFRDYHLWVFIDTPEVPQHREMFSMLICLEDLEAFTQMWHFSNLNHFGLNAHLRLKLTLQDPHVPDRKIPKTLQSQLLLPFSRVKGLHTFTITGPKLLESIQRTLKKDQEIPDPTPEECLERSTTLKESGNRLLKAGQPRDALSAYTSSFAAMHITVQGRSRTTHAEGYYIRELTSGPHKGHRGDYIRMMLRIQLVANVMLAYLRLEEWEEVYFWGKRSIVLFRRSVTGDRSGTIGSVERLGDWVGPFGGRVPAPESMGRIFFRVSGSII